METQTTIALSDTALFRRQCYVNGAWTDARSGDIIEVDNPATGEVVGTVPAFGRGETRAAIEAADAAWAGWRMPPGWSTSSPARPGRWGPS